MTGWRIAARVLGTAFVVLVAARAAAQTVPPPPQPVPAGQSPVPIAGGARITGIIKNADTDAPIARARVTAAADVLPEPRVALSEPDGRYALTDLPPGSYTVSVTRTGFAPQNYAQARSSTPTPVVIGAAQSAASIDFALVPGGYISGRILDEDGTPFAGALVEALLTRSVRGTDSFVSVSSCQTDDRGEFRLFGLAPGQYYVSAADPAFRAVSTPKGVLHYSPTYFPGVPFADEARAIVLTGMAQPPPIEFRLRLVPPARVTGRLKSDDGRPLFSAAIVMSPREGAGVPMVSPDDPALLPDGRFSFGEVAPGHYQIRARGQTDRAGITLFGIFTLQVLGTEVEGIDMVLRQGAVLDGRLLIASTRGSKPPPFAGLRVLAPFIDGNNFGDSLTGTVQRDGSFALRGMMPGAHQLVVDGLSPPWVLDSVMFHGANITDVQFDVMAREEFRDVRVTITDDSGDVSGTVRNARQLPVANTGVLVFPRVPLFWVRTNRRMRIAYTDRTGTFLVRGLPPGDYYAVASLAIDESDLGRGDRLHEWQRLATAFVLPPATARTILALPLVPPPANMGLTGR